MAEQLGRETRERFLLQMCRSLVGVAASVQSALTALMGQSGSTEQMQLRRQAWTQFQLEGEHWREGTAKAWQDYLAKPAVAGQTLQAARVKLELQDQDVVESQIVVSHFVTQLMEGVAQEFNTLRMRMKELEGIADLPGRDLLRPEVLVSMMLEQWGAAGMPEGSWTLVQKAAGIDFQQALAQAFLASNDFLAQRGILPKGFKQVRAVSRQVVSLASGAEYIAQAAGPDDGGGGYGVHNGDPFGGVTRGLGGAPARRQPGWVSGAPLDDLAPPPASSVDLALLRAHGVIAQLRHLLQERGAGLDGATAPLRSARLAQAMASDPVGEGAARSAPLLVRDVQEALAQLQARALALKRQADTDSEKAVIEVVALIFQSILTEDRIPSSVRIWVARLQIPVLRVALAEPEFFDSLDHPARLLIDRIGACVLGFDVAAINGSALEAEIRRVVQVIEQFPETGREVFQKVYGEFLEFLGKMLTARGVVQRVVGIVQQVEQKETLAVKYTIEMRNMLKDIPVRDEIRQFLFKLWADVLAVAAVKHGPQDPQTQAYRRAATDLVWSSSAKPSRTARTRVIQNLPQLLQVLRQGMSALGLSSALQEVHIKVISDTLADAFMSKTEAIPYAQIEAMTRQLALLEDVVPPDGMGDLPLDTPTLEMMLGMDASSIVVVAVGGTPPSADMVAWAKALTVGTWLTLEHRGMAVRVQFAWRSDKQKLHLFAAPNGTSYLIQAGRLAAYLQAGLLVPLEDEALTVRATRGALAQLEANPQRLVS
jgi:hypothetical protein